MLTLNYEYRVLPAPRRAAKARTARSSEERFAMALAEVMNDLGRDGWEYVRSDTLPMDERSGLTATKTSYFNMLVFRRVIVRDTQTYDEAGEVPVGDEFTLSATDLLRKLSGPKNSRAAFPSPTHLAAE